MRSTFAVLIMTLAIAGCVDTHAIERNKQTASLDPQAVVYVAVPKDGAYGATTYNGSGQMTANAVMAAFALHVDEVKVGQSVETSEEALSSARQLGAVYLAVPTILHWEDRATEWSGLSDRLQVKLAVLDGRTGEVLDRAVLSGKSKWATFGGDHPQDLLPEPVMEYVGSLY